MNSGRTHSDSRHAFRNTTDYAYAGTRHPRESLWLRLWRLFGGRVCRFD